MRKPNYLKVLTITLIFFGFNACNQQSLITEADNQLIEEIGFETDIIQKIRSFTDSTFAASEGNSDIAIFFNDSSNYFDFINRDLKGLVFGCTKENAERIVHKLKPVFNQKGYMIYRSEMNFGYSPDRVTVIKTTDKFDLLRFEGTNGINYDLYLEDVIAQLKDWDMVYDLEFIAVGFDFIEVDIKRLPKDITTFCNELYAFCPDIVEQGTGTIEMLKTEIMQTQKLFLWWD